MKILHTMAGGAKGGAEQAYEDILLAQKAAGMDVIAACRPFENRIANLQAASIPVFTFPFGGLFDFKTKRGLRELIERENIDIVQCWMSRAAKLTPKVQSCTKIARLGGYYNLKYYQTVDHFIGNTPDICRWLVEDHGIPTKCVTHINNFAELEPIEHPIAKSDFGTPDDAFVFLSLARLHPVKALDTGLKALAKTENAYFWIAGNGPEEQNLKNLADSLGVSDRVRWLGWRDDKTALLNICNAVLFPSRHEAFGNAFLQAWAAKRPLVTTASQGPSQYVTNGVDGLITPVDDVEALANSMRAVMTDKHLARKLVRNGFMQFEQEFKRKNIIKSYDILYKSLKNLT